MKKMLFTANDAKRLRLIEQNSPYANTIWLISKIRALVFEMNKMQKDLEAVLSYTQEMADRHVKEKTGLGSKLRFETAKYANKIQSLKNDIERLTPKKI